MIEQRHRQRRRNNALARNKHLFHVTYGCSPSGKNYDHASNCGQGAPKKRKAGNNWGKKTDGLVQTFLKRMKSKVKK